MPNVAARSAEHLPSAWVEVESPSTSPGSDRSVDWNSALAVPDDLSREVYCILGMPIDAIEMPAVMQSIEMAAASAVPFVISTPNINFLVNSLNDPEFRESLLLSDLCPADGMPVVWIARLMGIPIKNRIAGCDIFEALKVQARPEGPIKIFLFGAKDSVVEAAARTLNVTPGLRCVGWICPGWGSVDELSQKEFIDKINSSNADFLVATLGAIKGQLWLHRNHHRLRIPLRSHLGATIHFQAGTVKRAPHTFQKLGLEWLWRIKEEPYLWKRYFRDGSVLLHLLLTRVLPLAISARLLQRRYERSAHDLVVKQTYGSNFVTLSLSGFAIGCHVDKVVTYFRVAMTTKKQIVIDFSETRTVDARFLGFLLMLRKQLKAQNAVPRFEGISRRLERMFRLNGCGYLLPARVKEATPGWNRGPAIYGHLPPTGETVLPPISPLGEELNPTGEILPARPTRTEHPRVRRAL
ncbi:MAG: WecB/TagA/CpsF family glycosyltransferase [Steroidobacteraceae bacterium]|jgi:N-acetylglucosaminyldiphosphoundecaprenol N-acetyl-beta-D-mannosaminyltransferase